MTDDNLSRAEAQERSRTVSNLSYDLALDLTTGEETFRSETTATFFTPLTGLNTFVDLDASSVSEITFNGRSLDPSTFDASGSRIPLRGSRPTTRLPGSVGSGPIGWSISPPGWITRHRAIAARPILWSPASRSP